MKPEILALREAHRAHAPAFLEALHRHFVVHEVPGGADPCAFAAPLADRVRALVTTTVVGAKHELLDALPRLEIVVCSGGHVDRIDLAVCRARGIPVTNTPGVTAVDVADMAVMLVLMVARRGAEADRFVRAGRWAKEPFGLATRVTAKTAGIVGLGSIGRRIAERLSRGFGLEVLYHGPRAKPDVRYRFVPDLLDLARAADFLILSCASGPATRHLIGRPALEALGAKGFLVNIARGVVDDQALVQALADRTIAGAGLDVFEREPEVPAALFAMDNVVLLPHIGSNTNEAKQDQLDQVVGNLLAHFAGQPLLTPVTAAH